MKTRNSIVRFEQYSHQLKREVQDPEATVAQLERVFERSATGCSVAYEVRLPDIGDQFASIHELAAQRLGRILFPDVTQLTASEAVSPLE